MCKYKLCFQYPRYTDDLEYRYTWEYWGVSPLANIEQFKMNYSDHLILGTKDYV